MNRFKSIKGFDWQYSKDALITYWNRVNCETRISEVDYFV